MAVEATTRHAIGGGSMLGTASLRISDMTFMTGGRFTNSRSTGVQSSTTNTGAAGYSAEGGSGRFDIHGYDLQLHFSNGTQQTTRIIAPTQDMDMLVIGGTVYIRKGAR